MAKFDRAAHIEAIAAEALVRGDWRKTRHGDRHDATEIGTTPRLV